MRVHLCVCVSACVIVPSGCVAFMVLSVISSIGYACTVPKLNPWSAYREHEVYHILNCDELFKLFHQGMYSSYCTGTESLHTVVSCVCLHVHVSVLCFLMSV